MKLEALTAQSSWVSFYNQTNLTRAPSSTPRGSAVIEERTKLLSCTSESLTRSTLQLRENFVLVGAGLSTYPTSIDSQLSSRGET